MKTKALISFAVTVKLICVFVLAYAKTRFSHDAAQLETKHGKSLSETSFSNSCIVLCIGTMTFPSLSIKL